MKNYLHINQEKAVEFDLSAYDAILLKYLADKCSEQGPGNVRISYDAILRDLPILKPITQNKKAGVETLLVNLWCKDLIEYKWSETTFLYSLKGDAGVICEVAL